MNTRDWVETSAYGAGLGVQLKEATAESATLLLPFREANSNPGDALHGGCAASLGLIGGQVVARTALGDDFTSFHTAACHVSYLSAALGDDVTATTTLLRRGKEMCFAETTVATTEGKPISHITTLVRGRTGDETVDGPDTVGDSGGSDPGVMGPHVGKMPFTSARQLDVEHMVDSESRIVMPLGDANGDFGGGFHEGAALALLDTTGAMAAWAETGPGAFKASTAALQAQVIGSLGGTDLVGYGKVAARDEELFWADVEVADANTRRIQVRGTVVYRIIT
ncbi:MAG: hotdog fold thioesterase [Acidimicrobiia bacterium]|nr:hotdog fold thioesterase [Acidimicrobiia bacterium]